MILLVPLLLVEYVLQVLVVATVFVLWVSLYVAVFLLAVVFFLLRAVFHSDRPRAPSLPRRSQSLYSDRR